MLTTGGDLILKHKEIRGSKIGPTAEKILFCSITNKYPTETTYETSRLACLLVQNGNIMWNTLVLSDSMVFTKSYYKIECIDVIENNITVERILVRKYVSKRKRNLNHSVETVQPPFKVKKPEQAEDHTNPSLTDNLPNSVGSYSLHTINNTPNDDKQFDNIDILPILNSTVSPSIPTTIHGENSTNNIPTSTLPTVYPSLGIIPTNRDANSEDGKITFLEESDLMDEILYSQFFSIFENIDATC